MKRVYLCGPMKNCTWEQKTAWRERLKNKYGHKVIFHDPVEFEIQEAGNSNVLVTNDLEYIRNSDILMVNLWKPSIGTIMELVYAHQMGKIILILTSLENIGPWLMYHSSKIAKTEDIWYGLFEDALETKEEHKEER